MICGLCSTFVGNPCAICRTHSRIGWLLTVARLGVEQEAQGLQALRDCSGALADLVETKRRDPLPPPPPAAVEGSAPLDEGSRPLTKKEEDAEEERIREDKKKPLETKVDAKAEKEKKKKRKVSEDEAGVEETPEKTRGEKKKKSKEEHRGKEENPGGESSGSRAVPGVVDVQDLQATVDSFACNNPGSFELGTLPVRGSVGRHFSEAEDERARSRRPAEPARPPLRRDGEHSRRQPGERGGKKKSKGAKHRARGREWRSQYRR